MSPITPVLPLSVQWWTPENMAPVIGKSPETIRRRARELKARGTISGRRYIWSRSEAVTVADYIITTGRKISER